MSFWQHSVICLWEEENKWEPRARDSQADPETQSPRDMRSAARDDRTHGRPHRRNHDKTRNSPAPLRGILKDVRKERPDHGIRRSRNDARQGPEQEEDAITRAERAAQGKDRVEGVRGDEYRPSADVFAQGPKE